MGPEKKRIGAVVLRQFLMINKQKDACLVCHIKKHTQDNLTRESRTGGENHDENRVRIDDRCAWQGAGMLTKEMKYKFQHGAAS